MTSLPLRTAVTRSPFIVISNVFHSPTGLSAQTFGTAAARTSGDADLLLRTLQSSPDPHGQHQRFTWALPVPRRKMPESALGVSFLMTWPLSSFLHEPSGRIVGIAYKPVVRLNRQSIFKTKSPKDCSVQRFLSPVASDCAS